MRWTVYLYKGLLLGACVAMLSTLGAIVLGIAARELKWDIPGLDAYAGYAVAAALFLALPETLRQGDHIRVSLVLHKLPPAARNVLEYWCLLAAVALSGYLTWFSVRLVWVSKVTHDVSQAADATPLWIPQIAMAVGAAGLFIAFLDALIARVRGRVFWIVTDGEAARVE